MKLSKLVYMVLDECKIQSDDAYFTEDHVIFLLSNYRALLLKKELEKENKNLSSDNTQTICLDLIEVPAISGEVCEGGTYLRSVEKIPTIINSWKVQVYPIDFYSGDITYVSRERMKYTGYNKWLKNIIYASIGPDDYLYLKSENPQFLYLEKLRMNAIFEDYMEASKLMCDASGDACDPLDSEFPIEESQIPALIELTVKELLGANYRPTDSTNDGDDGLADLINWARSNMKSGYQNQIES